MSLLPCSLILQGWHLHHLPQWQCRSSQSSWIVTVEYIGLLVVHPCSESTYQDRICLDIHSDIHHPRHTNASQGCSHWLCAAMGTRDRHSQNQIRLVRFHSHRRWALNHQVPDLELRKIWIFDWLLSGILSCKVLGWWTRSFLIFLEKLHVCLRGLQSVVNKVRTDFLCIYEQLFLIYFFKDLLILFLSRFSSINIWEWKVHSLLFWLAIGHPIRLMAKVIERWLARLTVTRIVVWRNIFWSLVRNLIDPSMDQRLRKKGASELTLGVIAC